MSDALKHECGIALIRLKKPLEFYKEKYGTAFYGVNKMYLMMEKRFTSLEMMSLQVKLLNVHKLKLENGSSLPACVMPS